MKLSDIKKHPQFPFADFRTNDASFLMLELFWTQVAREALGEELSQKCVPLQDSERDDGEEKFYNPIMLDFWIPSINRGARISLTENFDNAPLIQDAKGDERFTAYYPFVYYLTHRKISEDNPSILQIVFCSDMSESSIQSTQNGLRTFLIDGISEETVEDMITRDIKNTPNYPNEKEWDEYYDRLEENGVD